MHERVRAGDRRARASRAARSSILDALLKLRQVCCDPRLVKLAAAKRVAASRPSSPSCMEMLPELIEDGRRVLVFSQFTSMLDLIGPELERAGMPFVELRGDTVDRADAGGALPGRRGAAVPDQPQGRRRRPEPDRGRHGDPLRPVVEPRRRGAGHRPRAPHRPGQAGVRLQADRRRAPSRSGCSSCRSASGRWPRAC